jgi:superfamily II RNA helicase
MPTVNIPPYSGSNARTRWRTPFDLDHFQRYALDAIDQKHNVLITAHTGSGKTLPAEYAIVAAVAEGKRAIYTAPIKTLSNQKYNELQQTYPDISFGILTGDVKHNPDAQCLIMTTEILRNTLFQNKMSEHSTPLFELGAQDSIGCIIFDEVHYINDPDRGSVWEEAIMLSPKSATLVMLSATINHSEVFAAWVEHTTGTPVEICSTKQRAVPLTHHILPTYPPSAAKAIENESARAQYETILASPIIIKPPGGGFDAIAYNQMMRSVKAVSKATPGGRIRCSNKHCVQQAVNHLASNGLLPAICFVFSRKLVQEYATALPYNLSDDSARAEADFESKVRSLSNSREHINSPEYDTLKSFIRRGIAIHHSGMVPVLKEAVELMFGLGHVKILLATETFAVGVNMPAKAVLFTSLTKRSNDGWRELLPHEYTQMAGRAGRRGKDTTGHVFILPAMFRHPVPTETARQIICGSSPTIESKFKIHFNLLLRLVLASADPVAFTASSMVQSSINDHVHEGKKEQTRLEFLIKTAEEAVRVPSSDEYFRIMSTPPTSQSTRRIRSRQLHDIETANPGLREAVATLATYRQSLDDVRRGIHFTETYIPETIRLAFECLEARGFVSYAQESEGWTVLRQGIAAANIQEVHSLVAAELLCSGHLDGLTPALLAAVLSSFLPIRLMENSEPDLKQLNSTIQPPIAFIQTKLAEYAAVDAMHQFDIAEDYSFNTALAACIDAWCCATNEEECRTVFASLAQIGVFKGEFIKCVLKIVSTAAELEKVAELMEQPMLAVNLSAIRPLLMKSVATNQSLYLHL